MIRVADKSCGNDYVYILTHPYSIGKIPHRFIMVRGRKKTLAIMPMCCIMNIIVADDDNTKHMRKERYRWTTYKN